MAALILPSRRVVQPQGPVEVDWANPLARGLVGVMSGTGPLLTPQSRGAVSIFGSVSSTVRGFVPNGATGYAQAPTPIGDYTEQTLLAVATPYALPTADHGGIVLHGFLGNDPARPTTRITLGLGGGIYSQRQTNNGAVTSTSNGQSYVGRRVCAVSSSAGANNFLYLDGVLAGQSTTGYAFSDSSTTVQKQLVVGRNGFNYSYQFFNGLVELACLWRRALSASEARAISENPWQLFRPLATRWPSASASVSLPTLVQPASTTSAGAWTATGAATLHAAINEAVPSAAEYISVSSASTCELQLANSAHPGGATQTLAYRASSTLGSTLTVTLKQGVTTIMSRTHALTSTDTLYTQTLTSPEIALIAAGPISVTLAAS